MKEVFDKLILIIENSNGIREKIEEETQKYYDNNKQIFQKIKYDFFTQIHQTMAQITLPDIGNMVEKIVDLLKNTLGEDNFSKIMLFQQQYPFLNNFFQEILPQGSKPQI